MWGKAEDATLTTTGSPPNDPNATAASSAVAHTRSRLTVTPYAATSALEARSSSVAAPVAVPDCTRRRAPAAAPGGAAGITASAPGSKGERYRAWKAQWST